MSNVLFLFAHQDDEYFALPWIEDEIRRRHTVACLFLTDGGSRTQPDTRNSESLRALRSLGVEGRWIDFVGTQAHISDGKLMYRLDDACAIVERWLSEHNFSVHRIYTPEYEGGHHDHDAVHIVASVLAENHGITGNTWSFAMYNASGCPRPFFRVLSNVPKPGARTIRYSCLEAMRLATFCWRYRSQARTWVGLFPQAFAKRVLQRIEHVNRLDLERIDKRPHQGELLYERLFGASYSDFSTEAGNFLRGCNRVGAVPGAPTVL